MFKKENSRILNLKSDYFVLLMLLSLGFGFKYLIPLFSIGSVAVVILIVLSLFSFCKQNKFVDNNALDYIFILFIAGYLFFVSMFNGVSSFEYQLCMQMLMLLFPYSILRSSVIIGNLDSSIYKYFLFVFLFLFIFLVVLQINIGGMIVLESFGGSILKCFFALSYFFVLNRKNTLLALVLSSSMNLLIGERTAAVVLLLIYLFYKLLSSDFIINNRYRFNLVFIFVLMSVVLFPFFYINLKYSNLGMTLNDLSREYTGGNFFSGREKIWEEILQGNSSTFIFGKGTGNDFLRKTAEIELSTHNLYLFLYLEGGICFLFFVFVFMFSIWKKYFDCLNNKAVCLSAAYFLGILIFLDFELLLLSNNLLVSFYFWFVICFGLITIKNKYG